MISHVEVMQECVMRLNMHIFTCGSDARSMLWCMISHMGVMQQCVIRLNMHNFTCGSDARSMLWCVISHMEVMKECVMRLNMHVMQEVCDDAWFHMWKWCKKVCTCGVWYHIGAYSRRKLSMILNISFVHSTTSSPYCSFRSRLHITSTFRLTPTMHY